MSGLKSKLSKLKSKLSKFKWLRWPSNQILFRYWLDGLVKLDEAEKLHQFYSPYKVPDGLTTKQIREKINHFEKYGNNQPNIFYDSYRIELKINGKTRLGATFTKDFDTSDTVKILKTLIETLETLREGKDVPDPEVLGKYSPKY